MYRIIALVLVFICCESSAQKVLYTTANAHSHNDYEQNFPFWEAWRQGFGSIEADIFLSNDELIVAHDRPQIARRWTLDSLYLQPLQQCITRNKGYVYADSTRQLQLMIDIKSEAVATLNKLVEKLKGYPVLTGAGSLHIVISGGRPIPSKFASYPAWIRFDGELQKEYSAEELKKIDMLSDNFARYSKWNGKGRLPEKEKVIIEEQIAKAHRLGKKIRFWNAPDILNTWYNFIELGVDYINTDDISGISVFLEKLPHRVYTADSTHLLYQPKWRNDGVDKPAKNIILLIGDGTGLAQWYAGYTANKGKLNVFSMRHTGLSKTSSYDNYITDSAPGATAFSSGNKTNNRAVGVDPNGKPLLLLPEIMRQRRKKTGVITTGDLRDATPAAFYAHQPERSSYAAITNDLLASSVDIIAGSIDDKDIDSTRKMINAKFDMVLSIDNLEKKSVTRSVLIADKQAGLSIARGRGEWAQKAFSKISGILSQNKEGFLLVIEGAQVDHGGHANDLPYAVKELLDFDKLIGKVMEFADSNGETLVIVTGDHETGGLTLTAGDYTKGFISGQFSTFDHTAIPVPVFAYGPRSFLFDGVYENTVIFSHILRAINNK